MDKIVFSENYQEFFAYQGLESFDNFYNYSAGPIINKNTKRNVQVLTFSSGDKSKTFYMKRFHELHLKDIFFTMTNFGKLCSQAAFEWHNAKNLLSNGLQTYKPACYGMRTILGIERKSFFITSELQSVCLTDFVKQNWPKLTRPQKEKIIVSLARTIRKIHNAKISLPDLYVWHIFIDEKTDPLGNAQYEFAFIDLHRMKNNVSNISEYIKNLARLDHSMLEDYFDENLKKLFIESYAGSDWPEDITTLAGKIKKHSDRISARRNQKPY
ncbi:MAG: hypothetical protein KAV87_15155 [Desulfobacteraceae bacterium]|nr:hypothetical protein [Desulfobacteraceae bacterium]